MKATWTEPRCYTDAEGGCYRIAVYSGDGKARTMFEIRPSNGDTMVTYGDKQRAALIVRAVNSHDALVEALREVLDYTNKGQVCPEWVRDKARALLAELDKEGGQ